MQSWRYYGAKGAIHYYRRSGPGAKELFNAHNDIKIIGTRHGEKLHETLLTREEFLVAEDLGVL